MAISHLPIEVKDSIDNSIILYNKFKEYDKNHILYYTPFPFEHLWMKLIPHLEVLINFIMDNVDKENLPNDMTSGKNQYIVEDYIGENLYDIKNITMIPIAIVSNLLRICNLRLPISDPRIRPFWSTFAKYSY